jgi:hypothetical protein
MTTPDPFELALVHFQPPLSPERRGPVLEALRAIAEDYHRNATNKVRFTAPMEKVGEPPEEYALRLKSLSATPRRKGRPKAIAENLLAWSLRALLIEEGCEAGFSEEKELAIAKLARFIHQTMVPEIPHCNWRKRAREVSDPLWPFQELFGMPIEHLSNAQVKEFGQEMQRIEVRPPKRKFN